MNIPPIVAVEIGTTKVAAVVGEMRHDGNMVITGVGEHPSAGVRKGEVVDLEHAVLCARSALKMAEDTSDVTIHEAYVAVSGGHIQSCEGRGEIAIGEGRPINHEDIEEATELARAVNLSSDRRMLHALRKKFVIDDQHQVLQPEGLEGAKLALYSLIIHGIRARLNNIEKVVVNVPVQVAGVAFSGWCSSLAVLDDEQRKAGVILLDMGGGKTDYVVFADGAPELAGSLGVGGDHVTNDIAHAFTIPTAHAESLKRRYGSAVPDPDVGSLEVEVPADGGFPGRKVKIRSLNAVINARLDELLLVIRKRLESERLLHHIGAGVVIAGGGSRAKGLSRLVEKIFGMPMTLGTPKNVSGITSVVEAPEYATCVGLVRYALMEIRRKKRSSLIGALWDIIAGGS